MKLPPGISAEEFGEAVQEFKTAVGKEWVFTSDEDVNLYRDAYSPLWGEEEELIASVAVAPKEVEEVQSVVRIANRYKIPLYPISTGKNLGYGGSAPTLSGSVVLDLKRMDRVLEVNENNAYVLVEPGVSYFDLYRHIQDGGYRLWIDTPDPGWGSVIGNALDHGVGQTAAKYRNHFDAHCGMEVVLPNGEVMRTGMGAMPGSNTWQQYKGGVGPWIDGMFSQSNFGVVTKMGFWLMPEPDASLTGLVSVFKYDDLIPLVDTLNFLENSSIFTGMSFVGSPVLNPSLDPVAGFRYVPDNKAIEILSKPGQINESELEKYCHDEGVGLWGCTLQFYGPPEVIRAQWKYAQEKFSRIDGVLFKETGFHEFPLTEEQKKKVSKISVGIPSLDAFLLGSRSDVVPNPTHGHTFFSPVIPRNGEELLKATRVINEIMQEYGLPTVPLAMALPFVERSFFCIWIIPITHDVNENKKRREAIKKMIEVAAENGWGEYRVAPAFQDEVMATYSFNNHALLRFHEAVKDAIDPNGIISPGRYGIWPKHLRDKMKP